MDNTDGNLAALARYEKQIDEAEKTRDRFMSDLQATRIYEAIEDMQELCKIYDFDFREELEAVL